MHWIDPDCLPEIEGRFERFLLNPHGDADGLMLAKGTQVHFPPHMGAAVVSAIEQATVACVRIRGVRPREGDVFAAVSIQIGQGARIEDRGPDAHEKRPHRAHRKREDLSAEGVVRCALHGPKGETRGVLLDTGVILRFPPHEAPGLSARLRPGAFVAASGEGVTTKLGTVIEAREIGADGDSLSPLGGKPPKALKPHERPHGREPHRRPA